MRQPNIPLSATLTAKLHDKRICDTTAAKLSALVFDTIQVEKGSVTTQGGDNVEGTVLVADMLCPGRHLGLSRYPRHSNEGRG